jgi:hypothetical protein
MLIETLFSIIILPIVFGYLLVLSPIIVILLLPMAFLSYAAMAFVNLAIRWQLKRTQLLTIAVARKLTPILVDFRVAFPTLKLETESRLPLLPFCFPAHVGARLLRAQVSLPWGVFFLVGKNTDKLEQPETGDTVRRPQSMTVSLADALGNELNLGSRNLSQLEVQASKNDLTPLTDEVRFNRIILQHALQKVGFVHNPLKWWFWTYAS